MNLTNLDKTESQTGNPVNIITGNIMTISQLSNGFLEPLALMPPLPTHSISKIRKFNSSENISRVGELETQPEKKVTVHYG